VADLKFGDNLSLIAQVGKRFKLPKGVFWNDFASREELVPTWTHQQKKTEPSAQADQVKFRGI
jgi:hypothetical protein